MKILRYETLLLSFSLLIAALLINDGQGSTFTVTIPAIESSGG